MVIIGCDFHPGFQQIAMMDMDTGEVRQLRLAHREEAQKFYAGLRGRELLVGMEACGYTQWFEQMLEEMGHRYHIGDAAAIRASYVRKQKTDRRDAGHILRLLLEGRFPALWVPRAAERDARQLIVHRHKRVQMCTRVKNQHRHSTGVAKVAVARKLALRLYWMLRNTMEQAQLQAGPYAGKPVSFCGRS